MRTLTVLGLAGLIGALGPSAAGLATAEPAPPPAAGSACDPHTTSCGDVSAPALRRLAATPAAVRLGPAGAGVHVTAVLSDASGVHEASVDVFDGSGGYVDTYPLTREAGVPGGSETWGGQLALGVAARPGSWSLDLDLTDVRGNWTWHRAARSFPVALDTQLDFDAAPERPLRGGTITGAGVLRQLVPGQGYAPYAGATVVVSFRPAGATRYDEVARTVTAADGSYSTSAPAGLGDGTWRAAFPGADAYAASTSRSDSIDVR